MSEKKPIDPQKIVIREFKITRGNIDCPDEFDIAGIEIVYCAMLNGRPQLSIIHLKK